MAAMQKEHCSPAAKAAYDPAHKPSAWGADRAEGSDLMRKSVVACYTIFGRVCCVDCTDEARAHDPYIRAVPAFDPYYPPREGLYCAFCGAEIKPPHHLPPHN
jgi:hypothetical protein